MKRQNPRRILRAIRNDKFKLRETFMPRIPYQPEDLAEPAAIVSAIRKRRGGTLHHLDRMLLNSPPFAQGWNAHLGAVRTGLTVSGKLRELAICAIAVLNGAEYEWMQHASVFLTEGGNQVQLDALRVIDAAARSPAFDATELAILALTIEMTRRVKVSDATFAAVKTALPNDQQIAEIIGVIATYNMVSRYLVALEITED